MPGLQPQIIPAPPGGGTLTSPVPIADGGTGSTSAGDARTALGVAGYVGATAGSADAYTATGPALYTGLTILAKIHAANTGASTLNYNSGGAEPILLLDAALAAGDLPADAVVQLTWDGSDWLLGFKPGAGAAPEEEWTRPSDWLAMPTVSPSEQKVVLLAAIYPQGNYFALRFTGAYTVDWGDGSAPVDVASNTTAEKEIAWADIDAGTLTSEGFRQCLVTITPQSGQDLTVINLQQRHSAKASLYTVPWLDITISMPANDSVGSAWTMGGVNVEVGAQRVSVLSGTSMITDFTSFFYHFTALQHVPVFDTSAGTNFSNFFLNCHQIQSLPLLDTSSGINFTYYIGGCHALQRIPLFDTSGGTTFTQFIYNCSGLQTVPAFNFSAATNLTNSFGLCGSLLYIPPLNVANVTSLASFLASAKSLRYVTLNGLTRSVSVASRMLNRQAIVDLFTSLGTASGAQTITVTGNPGAASLDAGDLAIATGKGWTVAT